MALAIGKCGRINRLVILLWASWLCFPVKAQPVSIRIDSVSLLDEYGRPQRVRASSVLRLPSRQHYITFKLYTAQAIPIRYRLDGLDEHWSNALSTDRIHYANLTGGTYNFRVQPANGLTESRLAIEIDAPFWKRWWFIPALMFYVLGILGILGYLLIQYRFRQKLRLLQTRDSIARDLHDDMGSYLGSISILSQSVLNVAQKNPQQARLLVDKIGETARQVMDSMSDIVWAINPDNDSIAQVVVRMRDVATDLLGPQDIIFHIDIDEAALHHSQLPLEQRRDFFLIYKESLTNIAKYASAHHVWVRIAQNGPALMLTIQDDGVGFDPQQTTGRNPLGGNGLKNMQVRAEKIGGTLTIQSAPGQGTQLILRILAA